MATEAQCFVAIVSMKRWDGHTPSCASEKYEVTLSCFGHYSSLLMLYIAVLGHRIPGKAIQVSTIQRLRATRSAF